MTASFSGPQPLHDQVRHAIAEKIRSGEIPPGARLQSERQLAELLNVSRVTVRRALGTLDEEGLIFATRGSGRYVSDVTLTEPPNMLLSFTELGARKGLTATARVLALHTRPATLEEADVFGAAPGAAVFELDRLRMLDDVPVAIDHVRVPLAVAPDLPTIDFRTASLYEALESAGAGVAQTEYSTEAVVADADQARELGVSPGDPLLLARSTGYDGLHRVVELGEMTYHAGRYRFRATLTRPMPSDARRDS